jgi:hypothetical protein
MEVKLEILFYIVIAIAINVSIFAVLRMIGKNRPKMSYNEYLQKYGSVGPYSRSDVSKFM